jgi:hypothetical protein
MFVFAVVFQNMGGEFIQQSKKVICINATIMTGSSFRLKPLPVKNPKRNFQKLLPKLVVGKIPS